MTLNRARIEQLYASMVRIRMFEESIAVEYSKNEMKCPVHLSIGQEAVAAGVCEALDKNDWIFSSHRNHAHYLAKGGNPNKMIAELYGKADGCCGGRGGSMHLTDLDAGFIAATPIVGSTVPIAAGAALSSKIRQEKRVVTIFLGDGAMEAGVVSETLNFASLKKLPLLFICENNQYSVYSALSVRQPAGHSLIEIPRAYGIPSHLINGNNVEEIYSATIKAKQHILEDRGPIFIEMPTYRWREHCGPNYDNHLGYREEQEFLQWKIHDPIELVKRDHRIEDEILVKEQITNEISEAFAFARKGKVPDIENLCEYLN